MRKVLVLLAVLAAAAGGWSWLRDEQVQAAGGWRTARVERDDLLVEVTATGALQPVTQVQVGTQVTGVVQALHADFNSRVTQGQVVAQIDPASFRARLESDKANLVRARADVTRVQALLRQAERELQRQQALVGDGLVTESEYEAALTNRDSLVAQLEVAQATVEQQEAALAVSEVNLQYTTIVSPIDGIVISRAVDVGQTVSASTSAPTLFVIAADLERMQVQAAVSEADIGRIVPGQKVVFRVDAFPGETFEGAVSQVRLASTTLQNVVTYTVLVDAPNPGGRLLPGMTADLSFEIDRADGALLVPDSALRFEPETAGGPASGGWGGGGGRGGGSRAAPADGHEAEKAPGAGRVHVLRDGQLAAVSVQVGLSDGIRTAIIGGELREGDEVVTGLAPAASGAPAGTSNPFLPGRPTGGGRPRL